MLPCLEAFHRLMYQPFYFLTDALRQGTNVGLRYFPGNGNTLYERLESHLEGKKVFHAWMAAMGTGKDRIPRAVIAALRDVDHLLDVGGGDANNAIDLVRQLENLSVTIFDLPLACDMAATNIEQAGLSNRIFTVAGNFLEDPFPTNVDAVMFAHIFNIYSAETNQSVIQKCSDMLKAGGKVVIFNLVSANDQSGPWHAAFLSLYFQVLATGDGFVYPTTCYEAWFSNAGFDSLLVHVDPRSGEGIFVGTK